MGFPRNQLWKLDFAAFFLVQVLFQDHFQVYGQKIRPCILFHILSSGMPRIPNDPHHDSAIQSPACERGILAKHPPGRRRKAAEKAGSKDFMTPLTGDPTGLTCDPYVWGCLGGLR